MIISLPVVTQGFEEWGSSVGFQGGDRPSCQVPVSWRVRLPSDCVSRLEITKKDVKRPKRQNNWLKHPLKRLETWDLVYEYYLRWALDWITGLTKESWCTDNTDKMITIKLLCLRQIKHTGGRAMGFCMIFGGLTYFSALWDWKDIERRHLLRFSGLERVCGGGEIDYSYF